MSDCIINTIWILGLLFESLVLTAFGNYIYLKLGERYYKLVTKTNKH